MRRGKCVYFWVQIHIAQVLFTMEEVLRGLHVDVSANELRLHVQRTPTEETLTRGWRLYNSLR